MPAPGKYGALGTSSPRPPQRKRTVSVENTSLTEVITIYEKLKKRGPNYAATSPAFPATSIPVREDRDRDVFLSSAFGFEPQLDLFETAEKFPEPVNLEPFFTHREPSFPFPGSKKVLDFNKFRSIPMQKYIYFSSVTGLLQASRLTELRYSGRAGSNGEERVARSYIDLLRDKQYWLNIVDPSEKDLALLSSAFQVHELTLRDIREGNTEEKLEVYKHYMYMSLRLLSEGDCGSVKGSMQTGISDGESVTMEIERDPSPDVEDVDFNILLFSNFIITIHDKPWSSVRDVLGFLNLLCFHGNSPLSPDWVLFSVFIELAQDARYNVNNIDLQITNLRLTNPHEWEKLDAAKLSKHFQNNFDMEYQIYKVQRFLKPKINVLKVLQQKGEKRLSSIVLCLMSNIRVDFGEMLDEVDHFSYILGRSQDTYMTMATAQHSIEANDLSRVMRRISELALLFLPAQAVGGFMGMNCKVPFQFGDGEGETTQAFWSIVATCIVLASTLFLLRRFVLTY